MIGNDIVDLKLASVQSNWRRKGWLQKIFNESEQDRIWDAEDSNHMVWKLWSMKEAAYKAHQRLFSLSPRYNPYDFICTGANVTIQNYNYQTVSKQTEKYVYTIAYTDQTNFISKIFTDESLQYKRKLVYYIANVMDVNLSAVTLQKDVNGIPCVKIHNKVTDIAISLSSHGSFSAFTIDL
ncbi:4-phosphopantetheinyl transferase family protein [Aquimarina sp. BL5]|uniref:4'-phosphopantetheinyl transferase family protein n=2 Tax=Aquimarina sp. BL5 TaxID=1714860 RepID=UPI000E4CFA3B|nr:4'-phosphopantetheinyl transferase superfamily protein [Aquimarina sp. BL5]AXT49658.1 4-phosphopantetheinyl transferase family protein [Aquimarina sp. BL5]